MCAVVGDAVVGCQPRQPGEPKVLARQRHRIDPRQQRRQIASTLGESDLDKGAVEGDVVGDDEVDAFKAAGHRSDDLSKERRRRQVALAQTGEPRDERRDRHRRTDERRKRSQLAATTGLALLHADADFDDVFDARRKTGGLDVDDGEAQLVQGATGHRAVVSCRAPKKKHQNARPSGCPLRGHPLWFPADLGTDCYASAPMTSTPGTSRSSSTPKITSSSSAAPPTDVAVRAGTSAFLKGHNGAAVASLQERLNRVGAEPVLVADGAFGAKTRAAVERFQQEHQLPVDGKVGARTLAALEAAVAAAPTTSPVPNAPGDSVERGGGTSRNRSVPSTPAATTATTVAPRRGLRTAASTPPASTAPGTPIALPAGLGVAARTTVSEMLSGARGAAADKAMTTLLGSAPYQALAAPAQAQLLTTVHTALTAKLKTTPATSTSSVSDRKLTFTTQQATALLQTTAFRTGSAADRSRLVEVFAAAPAGRTALTALAGANGGADRLAGRDLRGGTMLSHLSTIATGTLAAGIDRGELLASTMAEVANPSLIEQKRQGTCAATTVSLQLVARSPAEYVRLLAGLSSRGGSTPLADGSPLRRVDASITDKATHRSISERLLQDAFMDFANGTIRYSIAGNNGVSSSERSRLQSALFNHPYRTVANTGRFISARDDGVVIHAWNSIRNGWDRVTFQLDSDRPMKLLRERSGTPTAIGMHWGTAADSNHAVLVTKIENDRVYFQNPHGNAGRTPGQLLTTPPRRVEQGNVQSMTVAAFQSRLYAVSIPD